MHVALGCQNARRRQQEDSGRNVPRVHIPDGTGCSGCIQHRRLQCVHWLGSGRVHRNGNHHGQRQRLRFRDSAQEGCDKQCHEHRCVGLRRMRQTGRSQGGIEIGDAFRKCIQGMLGTRHLRDAGDGRHRRQQCVPELHVAFIRPVRFRHDYDRHLCVRRMHVPERPPYTGYADHNRCKRL